MKKKRLTMEITIPDDEELELDELDVCSLELDITRILGIEVQVHDGWWDVDTKFEDVEED